MLKRLGRFIRRVFGGGRPLATSDALMVGARPQAAAAPAGEMLRRAMQAAEAPPPAVAAPAVSAPVADPPSEMPQSATSEKDIGEKKAPKKRAPRKRKEVASETVEAVPIRAQPPEIVPAVEPPPMVPPLSQSPAPPPAPPGDVWFSDAVVWSLNGNWLDGAWSPPPGSEGPKRLEEFRAKAAEGKLIIWGRAGEAGAWEPIEAAYWRACGFEQFSFLEGRENVFTEPKIAAKPKPGKNKGAAPAKYSALKVSKRQVEAIWRPGAMH